MIVLWLLPIIVFLISWAIFGTSIRRSFLHLRQLIRTPLYPAAAISSVGAACIYGYATTPTPLVSPLTAHSCVLWKVRVEEKEGYGKNERRYIRAEGTSMQPVGITDETGTIVVELRHCTLYLKDRSWTGWHHPYDVDILLLNHLARHSIRVHKYFNINKLTIFEAYVAPDELLLACGTVTQTDQGIVMRAGEGQTSIVADRSKQQLVMFLMLKLTALGVLLGASLLVPTLVLWSNW